MFLFFVEWVPYKVQNYFEDSLDASCIEIRQKTVDLAVECKEKVLDDVELVENSHFSSVGEYFSHSFKVFADAKGTQEGEVLKETLESVFNNLILEEISTNGCDHLNNLDFNSFKQYVDLPGDLTYQEFSSYSNIVYAIHCDISKEFKLLKNHKVCRIITASGTNDGILIHCENGSEFRCDVAVLTVSLEVLRSMIDARTVFEPALPIQKTVALKHMRLSRIVKLFFQFQEPFPDPVVDFINFNMSDDSLNRSSYMWTDSFGRIKNSEWWLLWIMGPLIDEFDNSPSAELFAVNMLRSVQQHYKEFPQHLKINMEKVIASSWTDDPLYKGGYSYFTTGGQACLLYTSPSPRDS